MPGRKKQRSPTRHRSESQSDTEHERGRRRHRQNNYVSPNLATSPYLSSPIRPSRSSRSLSRGRPISQPQPLSSSSFSRPASGGGVSSFSSRFQPSPYEDTFSVGSQSCCGGGGIRGRSRSRSRSAAGKQRQRRTVLLKTILLPCDVEDWIVANSGEGGIFSPSFSTPVKETSRDDCDEMECSDIKSACGDDEIKYKSNNNDEGKTRRKEKNDRGDDEDDNSSVASTYAESLVDENVYQEMERISHQEQYYANANATTTTDRDKADTSNAITIKLPPVGMKNTTPDTHRNKDYDNHDDNYEREKSLSSSPSKYSKSIKNGPPATSSSFNLEFIEEVSSVAELSRQGTSTSPRKKKSKSRKKK